MRILIAPDSFKGSLKSPAVARAMARGAREAAPESEVVELPVGDGGEGTLDALVAATGGELRTLSVTGPLGEQVPARLGFLGDGRTVFVEMAEASGLSRVPPDHRDPLRATTYGTGELIRAALESGHPRILIGIGGSATTDGGGGALQALGVRLRDGEGEELAPGGAVLYDLESVDLSGLVDLAGREIVVACDVTNPLTGPDGAAAIYGPQKGAQPDDIRLLDAALGRFAEVTARTLGRDCSRQPGAGAAGGLGFGLFAYLGARPLRGVELVLDAVEFDKHVRKADLVLTGEGKIDRQTTAFGKTLTGIGERARRAGVPVIGLAGALGEDVGDYREAGLASVHSIVSRPMALEEAMENAEELISSAARRVVEVFMAAKAR